MPTQALEKPTDVVGMITQLNMMRSTIADGQDKTVALRDVLDFIATLDPKQTNIVAAIIRGFSDRWDDADFEALAEAIRGQEYRAIADSFYTGLTRQLQETFDGFTDDEQGQCTGFLDALTGQLEPGDWVATGRYLSCPSGGTTPPANCKRFFDWWNTVTDAEDKKEIPGHVSMYLTDYAETRAEAEAFKADRQADVR